MAQAIKFSNLTLSAPPIFFLLFVGCRIWATRCGNQPLSGLSIQYLILYDPLTYLNILCINSLHLHYLCYILFMNPHESMIVSLLRSRGSLAAGDLSAAMNVSQPTISRLLNAMRPTDLLRLGRARATRYALSRPVAGLGRAWPLYEIDREGHAQVVGQLHALEAGQWCLMQNEPWNTMRGTEFHNGLYPDLPWFLDDLRPRGFLGRCLARTHATLLGAPPDPRQWHVDHIVAAMLRFGDDLPGSFVLGEAMLETIQTRMLKPSDALSAATRKDVYPQQADSVLAGTWPGSSAAGEQPKFLARVGEVDGSIRHVIVKFSGRTGRPEDQRWADLLIAEHIANTVLSEHGLPSAATELIENEGRMFLESTRFDRVGAFGRRSLVSLEALDAAFFGEINTPWTAAADRLLQTNWITMDAVQRLSILWWFGTLIGNSDMHYGNVSLFLNRDRPLVLTPTYDMVPMCYQPNIEGDTSDNPLAPPPPPPDALEHWSEAAIMAEQFWQRLRTTPGLSVTFQSLAEKNAKVLSVYRQRFARTSP